MATLWDDIPNICCNCAVVLFYLLESDLKLRFFTYISTNVAVNMTKVVIKILQNDAATKKLKVDFLLYVCHKL